MSMIPVNENFVISELQCLMHTVSNKTSKCQNKEAVITILRQAAQEIAATKQQKIGDACHE